MSVYVLVHGGFMGGWVWRQVANYLRAAGHEVFTPTLTGLGERSHLANPEISLDTHIQDIVGVIECEELQQVILVGYSYGGAVVTGVAEKVPERLSRLVYLDAFAPKDGQSLFDIQGPEVARMQTNLANEKGDGWRIPLVVNPPRWQPHPLKTGTQPLEVKNPAAARIPRAYIHGTVRRKDSPLAAFMPALDRAAEEASNNGWWYRDISADHGVALSAPKELADLLLELG
jgi:pimeloyl-ACP methyl ester carboxylesterase